MGGDPTRVAFAGESAGGNLSVATAMLARDAGLPMPRAVLSVFPIAGSDLNTPSYQDSANGPTLNRALMAWFFHYVARTPADLMDARNLVAANLQGLPPVTIVSAQIDPLRSEGEMLAEHLQSQGVPVERRVFDGTTHEFFGADALISGARDAQQWAGMRLHDALWGNGLPAMPGTAPMPPRPSKASAGAKPGSGAQRFGGDRDLRLLARRREVTFGHRKHAIRRLLQARSRRLRVGQALAAAIRRRAHAEQA